MKFKEGNEIRNNKTNEIGTVMEIDSKNKRIKVNFMSVGNVWINYSQID